MKTLADESCQQELRQRLRRLRPETPRRWGRMSAHQAICHLSDAFRVYMGLKTAADASTPFMRTIIKWVALWTPMPWPHGFRTAPELDQQRAGTEPRHFDCDIDELLELMERMARRPRTFAWQAHPLFGKLSEPEWMRMGYLHTNHHLRQFGL